ncbi:repressor LexA [Symbiobacterium terraclitae]|uniref:LexA repressor n=1 Tax=Symbiobacterium terraclitae TaxID=557451 RepID=A0ABS4JMQ2_9FIRM|nr:transcriptional repressor LexA [Symbiobacterium terraclitae]MBP2016811.1 repressor LexA [Symbiobacterium terraclitae]
MPESLTERQRQILQFIKDEIRTKGYPPSVREIGEAIGLSSSSTVHGHMTRLEEKGYIRRDPTKPRAIEVLDGSTTKLQRTITVPVVGRVTAGQPILAQETIEDHFPLPSDFVRADESDLFFLKIQGDSMIEAGILDGDLVLVQRQQHANNGDIVVALIEDEATVKRFFKEQDHIRLQPENRFMDPIIVPDCQVLGKVVGLVRRMH